MSDNTKTRPTESDLSQQKRWALVHAPQQSVQFDRSSTQFGFGHPAVQCCDGDTSYGGAVAEYDR